jgi:hypothetical protein
MPGRRSPPTPERRTLGGAEDLDSFVAAQLQRGLTGRAVDQHLFLSNQFLDTGAADVGNVRGEELVQAAASVIGSGGELVSVRHS